MLQYGSVEYEVLDGGSMLEELNEDGFGGGWYARAGFELELAPGALVGIGVRWIDTYVDFGGGLQDLELEGTQVGLTVSQGF